MVLTTTQYGGTESQDPASPTELTNPMLNSNESVKTTSAILIEAMNTKPVATQLGALGPKRLVINDGRTDPNLLGLNGPFVDVVGESINPDEARRFVLDAQAAMRDKLLDWQEPAPGEFDSQPDDDETTAASAARSWRLSRST